MGCTCGRQFVWRDQIGSLGNLVVTFCHHGSGWGRVWGQNNEAWIFPQGSWPNRRHVGTFPTLAEAKAKVEQALSRGQH